MISEPKKPFWRQPFLHFVILGLLIFLWDGVRDKAPSSDSYDIVVTVTDVERLAALWTKTWGRPPSDTELQGLVRDRIKEEIYYREAKRLGLDQNDVVIRRRLRQKMEFILTESADVDQPSEAVLIDYYKKNTEKYKTEATFNLSQIYYPADENESARNDLSELTTRPTTPVSGFAINLPKDMEAIPEYEVKRKFGSAFWENFNAIAQSPELEGKWTGPIASGFGLHLVKYTQLTPASVIPFEKARQDVERDWRVDRNAQIKAESYDALLSEYNVTIETPEE